MKESKNEYINKKLVIFINNALSKPTNVTIDKDIFVKKFKIFVQQNLRGQI